MNAWQKTFAAIIVTILISGGVNAQWTVNTGSYFINDNNIYRNYNQVSDTYRNIYMFVSRDIPAGSANVRAYYNGAVTQYNLYSDRNSVHNTAGLVYTRELQEGGSVLNIGGKFQSDDYKSFYTIFDSKRYFFYGNMQFFQPGSAYTGGFSSEINTYKTLDTQNRIDTNLFVRYQRFFASRTGLHSRLFFGYNHYFNSGEYIDDDIDLASYSDFSSRIGAEVSVTQSLSDKTGLNISYEYSRPVKSAERFVRINTDYIFSETELFNMPYDYRYSAVSGLFTGMFDFGIIMKLSGSLQYRDYVNQAAMDLDGNPINGGILREDTRKSVMYSAGKKFSISERFLKSINAEFIYIWSAVDSNDPYYSYDTNLTSLNISLLF